MTDNRTTELREKLDELGIEHFDYDKGGRTQTMWQGSDGFRHFTYETAANPAKTARLVIEWFPTPDQAIAATLGSDDEYEAKMDELLCRLTNGKWSKSRQYSLDFMKACVDEEYEDAYNELNAERHVETCENMREKFGYKRLFVCSECGVTFDPDCEINYCPCCGREVVNNAD